MKKAVKCFTSADAFTGFLHFSSLSPAVYFLAGFLNHICG
jgi:hypothetical protein